MAREPASLSRSAFRSRTPRASTVCSITGRGVAVGYGDVGSAVSVEIGHCDTQQRLAESGVALRGFQRAGVGRVL